MRIADGSKRHGKQLVDTTNACTPTLTTKQQRLVQDNIGLVAVHLKRHVSNLAQPRRDREWDDLFQEGCLGLIEAARRFRKQLGIPFAAFALPRIHNAISKALYTKFSTVYVPPPRADRQRPDIPTDSTDCERFLPKVISMSDEQTERLADRRRPDVPPTTRETIGQRLQEKYERAVRMAQKELSAKASIRGDRDELVRILTEERLLIPQEESRRALRQIARDTHSSYARVAQCDRLLNKLVRERLQDDPEFMALQRHKRSDPNGVRRSIDPETERSLVRATVEEYADRFRRAPAARRAEMLHSVLRLAQNDIDRLLRTQFSRLSGRTREQLLSDTSSLRDRNDPI